MTFKPGTPRPANSGRRPGSPNRVTRAFKEILAATLVDDPETTTDRLLALRDSDEAVDRSTYWRMAARFVPSEVSAKLDAGIVLKVVDRSDSALIERDEAEPLPEPRVPASDERTADPGPLDLRDVPRELPAPMPAPAVTPIFLQRQTEDFQDSADFN